MAFSELRGRIPFSIRVSAIGALSFGRTLLFPGADVAISVMPPIPTEW
jgi:hypothetical protein